MINIIQILHNINYSTKKHLYQGFIAYNGLEKTETI